MSRRVWWWPASHLTRRWWPLVFRGGDEYGNATIALRVPGGMIILALNLPLRRTLLEDR